MRYVRPREFRLNPRASIDLLDDVVERFKDSRRTFAEEEALAAVWAAGEDIRLREDSRFWEVAGTGQFHLSAHRLANRVLAEQLWSGVWDGTDLDLELASLDVLEPGTFHVFCAADQLLTREGDAYALTGRAKVPCAPDVAARFDFVLGQLLENLGATPAPTTTRALLDSALRLDSTLAQDEDALDHFESWLAGAPSWTEVAQGLWLPTSLVPRPETPRPLRVRSVTGLSVDEPPTEGGPPEFIDLTEAAAASPEASELEDPPVEREPDATVRWTHTLRTIHLQFGYLPVPSGARFRYPRFVGRRGPLAFRAILHETGEQGWIWLDRENNRWFGDLLRTTLEWEEAGRRIEIRWSPEAVRLTRGELDEAVHAEESRLVDPDALNELRGGKGESYRQSLARILRSTAGGLTFRHLYEKLGLDVGHRPNRGSIRTVLSMSPEFALRGSAWCWSHVPESERRLRRGLVLAELGIDPERVDTEALARKISDRALSISDVKEREIQETASSSAEDGWYILPYRGEQVRPVGTVPILALRIAAGGFSDDDGEAEPEGWLRIERRGELERMFASIVRGVSMEPTIPDGSLCLFRRDPAGSREGRIVLVRDRRIHDPENGRGLTVRRYHRTTAVDEGADREDVVIELRADNPAFGPIVLKELQEDSTPILAELVAVCGAMRDGAALDPRSTPGES